MTITILIVTYDRPTEIRRTIDALRDKIQYAGPLRWHIADDGSPGEYVTEIVRDYQENLDITATVTPRLGWGANVNKALQHPRMTDLIFLCEDDYIALHPLNFNYGAALLLSSDELGVVRYDGLEGHVGLNMWLKECKVAGDTFSYLEIDREKSTHLNIYSNRPHLRHRRWHDALGLYPENLPLGKTEETYAHRVRNRLDAPGFAVLMDGLPRAFDHIGKSRQGTEKDTLFKA